MANPFVALESVPVMATITDMLQRQADLQRTQASTQLIGQQTQVLNQQVESEKKFQAGLAQLANAKQAQESADKSAPQPFGPFGNSEMAKPIIDGYRSESQSATQYRQLAQVAINAGDYARQKQYEGEAIAADNRAREWYTQGLKLAQDQRKELAATAGSYDPNGSNLQDVVAAVKAVDPKLLNGSQFDRDGQGNIKVGDGTTKAFETISNQSMSRAEQLSAKREADKIVQDSKRNALSDARIAEREKMDDARLAVMQHGMTVQDKRLDLAQEQVDLKKNRLTAIASKPANETMKKSARATILAADPEAKWDDTIDSYTADVADRANKIRADEARAGNDMGLDDARQQAIDELSPFVSTKQKGGTELFGHKFGGTEVSTYTRSKSSASSTPTAKAVGAPLAMPATKDKLEKGKVYNTARGAATWDGEKFVKTD